MTAETKFTPGPWVVGKGAGWFVTRPDAAKRREGAITVGMTPETSLVSAPDGVLSTEAEANAHLIAAAPDLYAALEDAADKLPSDPTTEHGFTTDEVRDVWLRARAALAKARGEQP